MRGELDGHTSIPPLGPRGPYSSQFDDQFKNEIKEIKKHRFNDNVYYIYSKHIYLKYLLGAIINSNNSIQLQKYGNA